MFKPGGYSSEEDSDEFDHFELAPSKAPELTELEKKRFNLDQIYKDILRGNNEKVLEFFKESDVNMRFRDNWTPLLLAASVGNDGLVSRFIALGADVNLDRELFTPLMAACSCPVTTAPYEQSAALVTELLLYKADVTCVNRKRMNALMMAASSGNAAIVNILLPLCNKNAEDNQGWTALFWAINDNQLKIVQLLLDAGLDPDKRDVRRLRPIDYAKQFGYHKIANILPDEERENDVVCIQNLPYNFEEEIASPRFLRDIYLMLFGMNCERVMTFFMEADDLNLLKFLTLTVDDLKELGIKMPYQQNRILGGLYRFHKYPYKKKSVPIVPKENVYTTINIAEAMISAMRHLICMQGSVMYLRRNITNCSNSGTLLKEIEIIQRNVTFMKRGLNSLRKRTVQWDLENEPADLIKAMPKRRLRKVVKWSLFALTISAIVMFRCKR